MPDVAALLAGRLRAAFDTLAPGADPVLRPSERADFQANGALALAKQLGRDPRDLAAAIAAAAQLDDVCERVEVSGPGFLNLFLSTRYVEARVRELAADPRLGVEPAAAGDRVVVTYSHPNVAKEMHVGHLRSTVIGDALCRVLAHLGHDVVRENHIGDWGTPFGMLIEHLLDVGEEKAVAELTVGDLTDFYQAARASFEGDEDFKERSRRRVVLLQHGDVETLRMWRVLVEHSIAYFDEVYAKLGVLLTDDDVKGESYYNAMLPDVVADLDAAGLLVRDGGALCVFPPGFTNREGDPLPLIVQKSDGGFGYAATDLACIRDRVDTLGAARLLYVVGAPQSQHLQMCFAVARIAGWLPAGVRAEHVAFGSVLGTDHKMLRTRAGTSVKLVDLLDEAVARAADAMAERGRDTAVGPAEREAVARALGIGAVKYADLSTDRVRDYVFDWDRMLSFEGDTGPYLQYAHARIRSIFRRAGDEAGPPGAGKSDAGLAGAGEGDADPGAIALEEPEERALGISLLGYGSAIRAAADESSPSKLCAYLFHLATTFTVFYERCPVLRAPDAPTRKSRLALAQTTARVLAEGLGLLGMEAPERM
ncbi:MAG: arginine--tRNA ligase [Actinomycetota bacterium]|nr:arginine--tRNA ligase [Actinomycetota bacterium]